VLTHDVPMPGTTESPTRAVADADLGPGRLTAFSDGVLAVIITITALGLRPPDGTSFDSLAHRLPALLIYILSFAYIGIYWNNHHHLFRATERINGGVMWANLHLLFWLSLIPVLTEWVGTDYRHALPAAAYGAGAVGAAVAYGILVRTILAANPPPSLVATAIGGDFKGNASVVVYAAGIGLAFLPFGPWLGYACFAIVAIVWFIPDRRLTKAAPRPSRA